MNRPPAARRAPEAREADPTWARTGQPQRRWLALRSPRREPTPREHGARVREARGARPGGAPRRPARRGRRRAPGSTSSRRRRLATRERRGDERRAGLDDAGQSAVGVRRRARVRCAVRRSRRSGRCARACGFPACSCRLKAETTWKADVFCATDFGASWRASWKRFSVAVHRPGPVPRARRSARSWDGSGQARESDNRRGRGGNEIHREGRAPRGHGVNRRASSAARCPASAHLEAHPKDGSFGCPRGKKRVGRPGRTRCARVRRDSRGRGRARVHACDEPKPEVR
jgi:hypothetical protein